MPKFAIILAAAGRSSRFGDSAGKKPFVSLAGEPVWFHSAKKFHVRDDVKQIIVVVSQEDLEPFQQANADRLSTLDATVVAGGAERIDSVAQGLAVVRAEIDYVAIHDAARPCVPVDLIEDVFDAAARNQCVVPAVPVSSTVKRSVDGGKTVAETVDRNGLFLSQTPQVFQRATIDDLFRRVQESASATAVTDEAQLAERLGVPVGMVGGSPFNIKLTAAHDLTVAEAYLGLVDGVRSDTPVDPPGRMG